MKKNLTFALAALIISGVAFAASFNVGQKNKQFTMKHLKVKVGDTVRFTNEDSFFHNVFSLSPSKTFDLGSYPKGEFRDVVFDKPGKIEVECAIHPSMRMTIEVK